jgi:hypothetical protein
VPIKEAPDLEGMSPLPLPTINNTLIIAIDLGMTCTGVAYAWRYDTLFLPDHIMEKVVVFRNWQHPVSWLYPVKTDTVIAYKDGNPVARGSVQSNGGTEVRYFTVGLDKENRNYYLQYSSAETLDALGGFFADPDWKPYGKEAIEIVRDYLSKIRQHVMAGLSSKGFVRAQQNDNIKYILTAPESWSDMAKRSLTTAAEDAGLSDVEVVTEGQAAAIYCMRLCGDVELTDDDCFIICDAGGATVVRFYTRAKLMLGRDLIQDYRQTSVSYQEMHTGGGSCMRLKLYLSKIQRIFENQKIRRRTIPCLL